MTDYTFLLWTPLISAAAWFSLSAYLISRERYRTWTELFFLGLCAFTGGYAVCDAIFFRTSTPGDERVAASASLSALTLGSVFLAFYGISLHGRFRPFLLSILLPAVFFIIAFPGPMFTGFQKLGDVNPPFVPVYNQGWYLAWLGFLAVLWIIGILQITRTFLEVRRQSPKLSRRIGAILVGFLVALLGGLLSNGLLGLNSASSPPLFSTFLALPGVLIFLATTPEMSRHLNDALLRRRVGKYDVKAVFLTFSDGTLIGSKIQPEESMIDADSFSATLDVIQNFMRTSFPTLHGKWLKSIRHGDYTLVMERGRQAYLTLVLAGQENDQLRRRIIERLVRFEDENLQALTNWRGMAKDAVGVDALLDSLLAAS